MYLYECNVNNENTIGEEGSRKGSHLIKSTSLEGTQSSALLLK